MDKRIAKIIKESIHNIKPAPVRPAWHWAEEKRSFPAGHGHEGPYRVDKTPWIKPITERVTDETKDVIVFCCASQLAKTDGFLMNVIGWKLDENPQPVLYIGPTEKNVLSISRDRLSYMIDNIPSLSEALSKGKADTLTSKYVNGVRIGLGWAGSATEAASHSVAIAIVDEYDRMRSLKNEGDIVGLVTPRIASYIDGKVIITSTPLDGDVDFEKNENTGMHHWKVSEDIGSPTWKFWQMGTRHEWSWPCPDCYEYFIPRMEYLMWGEDDDANLAKKNAYVACPNCGSNIKNKYKYDMNLKGVFVSPGQSVNKYGEVEGEELESSIASYWVSGLCSNFKSNDFGNLAYKKVNAYNSRDDELMRTVVNTGFGECYKPIARNYGWEKVLSRSKEYSFGQIPEGVKFLVMGSDLADERIDWVVRGFGDDYESWLIDRGEVYGKTDHLEVFRDLEKIEQRSYGDMKVVAHGIDSGYRADNVYDFVWKDQYIRHATKGEDILASGWRTKKSKERIVPLTHFSTDMAKSWVHARLDWNDSEAGAWHVPEGIDRAYCRQIVAEIRTINRQGKPRWKRLMDNHKLDCEAICYIMALMVGPIYMSSTGTRRVIPRKGRRMISRGVSV